MVARERYEYHLAAGQVVQHKVDRPPGKKVWRFRPDSPTLIAVIEPSVDSFSVHPGPAATNELIVEAVGRFLGLYADPRLPDLGSEVPVELAKDLGAHVSGAIHQATSQYRSFAEETDLTGFLKGIIQKSGFSHGDWRAEVKAWTYSRRPKERDLGVDIGLIVDVLYRDLRTLKAMWFQAKKSDRLPRDIFELPDLRTQVSQMHAHTSEAYALIYTPEEMFAFRGDRPQEPLSVESVVYDGVLCRRGDRTPRVIALTGDSKVVVEMLITA